MSRTKGRWRALVHQVRRTSIASKYIRVLPPPPNAGLGRPAQHPPQGLKGRPVPRYDEPPRHSLILILIRSRRVTHGGVVQSKLMGHMSSAREGRVRGPYGKSQG